MNLKDEICLVTGASRGIGKAIAERLASQGATVIGTATSESGAAKITESFKSQGFSGEGMVLNVANPEQIIEVVDQIKKNHGAVSVLVNNAGITRDNLFLRMKEDEWLDIIHTNLSSVYRLCKACIKDMSRARKGRIINIASVVGVTGNSGQVNYSAAKAGIIGMSKSLAQEFASRNITVNSVAPGFIQTDMTSELPEQARESILSGIPMARLGSADDIAAAVAFLASSDAAYITGLTMHVNGGMYMN